MNWKLIALTALAIGLGCESANAQYPYFRGYPGYRNPGRIVIPEIQIGTRGPIIRPAVPLQNGITILPSYQPQRQLPIRIQPVPQPVIIPQQGYQPFAPAIPVTPILSEDQLERQINFLLRSKFGRLIKDVDVDLELRKGKVEVEVEIRDPRYAGAVRACILTMPELRGLRVELDIDVDD